MLKKLLWNKTCFKGAGDNLEMTSTLSQMKMDKEQLVKYPRLKANCQTSWMELILWKVTMLQAKDNLGLISINSINGRDLQVGKKNLIWRSTLMITITMKDQVILLKEVGPRLISLTKGMEVAQEAHQIFKCNMPPLVLIDLHPATKIHLWTLGLTCRLKTLPFLTKTQRTLLVLKLGLTKRTSREWEWSVLPKMTLMTLLKLSLLCSTRRIETIWWTRLAKERLRRRLQPRMEHQLKRET